jgi:hypothetical protein
MAESRQVRGPAGGGDALGRLVDFQPLTELFDALGGTGPHCAIGVGAHGDVLQPAHGGHEPIQLRGRVNRFDLREAARFRLGVRHDYFHTSRRSLVVVRVASSDSVLSMIAVA